MLALLAVARIAVDFAAAFQIGSGSIELAAVLEDRGERAEGELSLAGLGVVGDRLVDLDGIEFIGKRESFDSGGQPGDRLVILQGVERKRAGRLGVVSSRACRSSWPAIVWVPNWPCRNSARVLRMLFLSAGSVSTAWASAHRQRWPSFLAFSKAFGHRVVDGRAVGLDGGCDRRGNSRYP